MQYCSTDANHLFFGYQTAKEHLAKIEDYDNYNYHKLFKNALSPENSISPKPIKHLKTHEMDSAFSQPIKFVEKKSESLLSSMSTSCTKSNLPIPPVDLPSTSKETFKLNMDEPPLSFEKVLPESESSSDFDFEAYFARNNDT